ncbi:DUF4332 domain-containing protein [Methylobacterium oryzisoli]|uniref:DUF4332 domain-containing protein n=1 Tax=Methylobacterium oryzisoli TaxID=3385502 RepID=UPI0038925C3F
MAYPIDSIGIGPVLADRLRDAGITTTDEFLDRAGDAAARRGLAEALRIDPAILLAWAGRCDLFRIHGLGRARAELLEAAGIRTVAHLATSTPDPLAARLAEVNRGGAYCAVTPGPRIVADWVAQAGQLVTRVRCGPEPVEA